MWLHSQVHCLHHRISLFQAELNLNDWYYEIFLNKDLFYFFLKRLAMEFLDTQYPI